MVATSVSMVVQFKPIKKTAITSKKGCDAQLRGCSDPITIVVQHERRGGDRGKKNDRQNGIIIRFTMDLADLVILLSAKKLLDRTVVANLGVPAMDHDEQSWYTRISFLVTYLLCSIFWIYTFVGVIPSCDAINIHALPIRTLRRSSHDTLSDCPCSKAPEGS